MTPTTIEELQRPPEGYTARYYNPVDVKTERRTPALSIVGAEHVLNALARNGFDWAKELAVGYLPDATLVALARRGVIVIARADRLGEGLSPLALRITRKGAAAIGRADLVRRFDKLNRARPGRSRDLETTNVEASGVFEDHRA